MKAEQLKANPNKPFLEQLVQLDIDKRNEVQQHIKLRTSRLEARKKEQEAKKQTAENEASVSKLNLESKNRQAESEKQRAELDRERFQSETAKIREGAASLRFPSAYFLMLKIEESLNEDDIHISLKTLGEIVAALFGYESFDKLLDDKNFNNETLEKIEYVCYDDLLAKRLDNIVLDEGSDNEYFSADLIFDCFNILCEDKNFKFITSNDLKKLCLEYAETQQYNILQDEGLSKPIAMSDTTIENIDDIYIDSTIFDDKFIIVTLAAKASGYHRSEEGVPGRTITASIEMQCDLLVGKYGLSSITQKVSWNLDDDD
ncbi:cell envelope integrity protein TolA [Xenorhabdus bharatensis]|uniref:cell envelope integrity protein TolA n=1 Tax=Xenorhabdus bharatensis TaxID=3136256 RepID=UPI0030F43B9C